MPGPVARTLRSFSEHLLVLCGFLCLCFASGHAAAQEISRVRTIGTVAGSGTAGYSGDGSPATSAQLNSPSGIVVDSSGNLYIADAANHRIREVAVGTGAISTFAGNGMPGYSGDGGPATSAELNSPAGVALDSAGNLYIADQGNNVIRKVSAAGTITTIAGNHGEGYSGDNGSATNATLYAPAGVALDSAGNLYIADQGNHRIRMVNPAGTIVTFAGNGTAGYSGDNGPATGAELNKPSAVLEDSHNNLYLADTGNNVVRQVNSTGMITTIAGTGTAGYTGDGGPAASATLNAPYGLAIDSAGNLYIADAKNSAIRNITAAGYISTITGNGTSGDSGDGGPATAAILNHPIAVVLDGAGNLYLSDQANERVRQVSTPTGSVLFPGTTAVSSTSAAVTLPLQVNTPGTTIRSITVPVSEGGVQEFAVSSSGCPLNMSLSAGTICNVAVNFTPGYPGQRIAPLQVTTSSTTLNFGLSGLSTAPQIALSPGIMTTLASTIPGNTSLTSALYLQFGYAARIGGGLVLDNAGNVFASVAVPVGAPVMGVVAEFPAGANSLTQILVAGDGVGNLGLALDGAGDVYAAIPGANCIQKSSPGSPSTPATIAGTCKTNLLGPGQGGFGGDNGLAVNAQLNNPSSLVVDNAGNLYFADSGNHRIRKIAANSGIITTIAGNGTAGFSGDGGPAASAELNGPTAIVLDNMGNLYIADSHNDRIRKMVLGTGVITTVAGNGTAGYSGDNGPATSAELNDPTSLASDSAGNIYFVDFANNVVRRVNTAGIIATVAGNGTLSAGYNASEYTGPATGTGLSDVTGIALDGQGNLYIATDAGVRIVNVAATALTFPAAQIGSTNLQSVDLTNIGNAALSFAVPASGNNPNISIGFAQDSSSSCPQLSAGSQPANLASGTSCSLVIGFVPTTATNITGTASITDNALYDNLTQTVQLTAGAGETVATTTTFNVATPTLGSTAVSATVLATSGTMVPTGSVVFTVDGATQPAVPVNSSGVATLSTAVSNALTVGSHTLDAAYTSSSLGFGNSVATLIFSVAAAPPPSVAMAPTASSLSVTPGSSVMDTITITPVSGYTGTLQFSCVNLPQNTSCSFKPSTVTLSGTSGPQATVVTIQTSGGSAALLKPESFVRRDSLLGMAAAFWAPGLLGMVAAGRKRKICSLALLAGILALSSCGGGGSKSSSEASGAPSTPVGTSTVQISATAGGSTVQSFTLTLTVQ